MNQYLIEAEEIKDLTTIELKCEILNLPGIKLSNLQLEDLVFYNGNVIQSGNGVYIFKEKKKIIYVGKCSSRNFVERIPAHFDTRHTAWFNSLLLHLTRRELKRTDKRDITNENLARVAKYAFENLELVLINFKIYDKAEITKLEDLLRMILEPLNKYKTKSLKNPKILIREFIEKKNVKVSFKKIQ